MKVLSLILGHWILVRNERAGGLMENFLISAVVAILGIRLYLQLAAGTLTTQLTIRISPQSVQVPSHSAPAELHIAHMLWGGLLMLTAIIMLLAFLSRSTKEFAAIIGGGGFGFFIDELGKFITGDNNYFFQPAIALIYVFFVLLFIIMRAIQRTRPLPERDAKANALEVAKHVIMGEGGPEARAHALDLLSQCDQKDSVTKALQHLLAGTDIPPPSQPHLLNRGKNLLYETYIRLLRTRWFPIAVVALFVMHSILSLYETLAPITWSDELIPWVGLGGLTVIALYSLRRKAQQLQTLTSVSIVLLAILVAWAFLLYQREAPASITEWFQPFVDSSEAGTGFRHTLLNVMELLQVLAPTMSGVMVLFGIIFIWHSRLAAYQMFQYAVLVSILLTQVFAFYEDQLLGVLGLIPNLVILAILRFLISTATVKDVNGERDRNSRISQIPDIPKNTTQNRL